MREAKQQETFNNWQRYTKAGMAFIATTATYFAARTTGLLPAWFRWDNSLSTETADSSLVTQDAIQPSITRRHLLQSGVVVANPIPDQLIDIAEQYTYSLDNVFSGDFELLKAVETGQKVLPNWLNLQYKSIATVPMPPSTVVKAIAVQNNTAFVAVDWAGLQVIDIADPGRSVIVSSFNIGGYTKSVAVQGELAYICKSSALQIVNVSNPYSPQLISTYNTGTLNQDIVVRDDNIIFMVDYYTSLKIINASNPVAPVLISSYQPFNSSYSLTIAVQNNLVVVGYTDRLLIINVTNLYSPVLIGSSLTVAAGISLRDNIVYAACGAGNLQFINITNPAVPSLISYYGGRPNDVVVRENIAFIEDGFYGLQIIDISNLKTPILIGGYNPASTVLNNVAVAFQNTFAFISSGYNFEIIDLQRGQLIGIPSSSQVGDSLSIVIDAVNMNLTSFGNSSFQLTIDEFPKSIYGTLQDQRIFPGNTLTLNLDSNLLFRKSGNPLLRLSLRLSDEHIAPTWLKLEMKPKLLSSIGSFAGTDVDVNGNTVFITGNNGMSIIDVSDLSNPITVNLYTANGYGLEVFVENNVAYLLGPSLLKILNISNLALPTAIGSYTTGGGGGYSMAGLVIKNSTAYIGCGVGGFQILNVGNMSAPLLISKNIEFAPTLGITQLQDVTFIGRDAAAGLQAVNVSNTTNPIIINPYVFNSGVYRVFIQNNIAFASAGWAGLKILNISDLMNPTLISGYLAFNQVWNTVVQSKLAFLAHGWAGMRVLDISNLTNPTLVGTYNPNMYAIDVEVQGQQAYLSNNLGDGGLSILDLSQWQLTATPTAADEGNYLIRITATDNLGGSDSSTFTLRVEGPPRITGNITNQYAQVGQAFAYFVPQGLVQDPNFDVISFSAKLSNGTALPAWLNFNGVSAIFAGTPTEQPAQNLTIVLIATDNIAGNVNATFNLHINHAPLISQAIADQVAGIDLPYQFTVPQTSFLDQDSDPLTYSARLSSGLPLPTWLSFNRTIRVFSGVANSSAAGSYDLDVFAADPYQGQARAGFRLLVEHFPRVNRPIADVIIGVGQLFDQTIDALSFVDEDDATLNYAAYRTPNIALPSWLSFTPQTFRLYGTPSVNDLGVLRLRITATDFSGGSAYQEFNLTTTYFPAVVTPIATPSSLRERRFFNLSISRQTFQDLDDPMLIYNASRSDGSALPAWLSFDANQLIFAGMPGIGDAGTLSLSVNAFDSQGNQGRAPLDLTIQPNYPPEVKQPISNQVASVLVSFDFFVPISTFEDPNNDLLSYSARLTGGGHLPVWLKFDAATLRFYGTPGRSDTGDFGDRVLDVDLVAADDLSQTSTNFRISVTGNSNLALFLKIGGPLFTAAGLAFGLYKKRSVLLNRYQKQRYQKLDQTITVGEAFFYPLETPVGKVAKVQAKLQVADSDCIKSMTSFFKSPHDRLPGYLELPTWMEYDTERNALCSKGVVPLSVKNNKLIIQIKDADNITQEQFILKILPAAQNQLMGDDVDEQKSTIEMRDADSHRPDDAQSSSHSALSILNSGKKGSPQQSTPTEGVELTIF